MLFVLYKSKYKLNFYTLTNKLVLIEDQPYGS